LFASNILFVKAASDAFIASEESTLSPVFTLLYNTLKEKDYTVSFSEVGASNEELLEEIDVLVAGIPEYLRGALEPNVVERFLERGGSVLLITNAITMMNPPSSLNEVASLAGIRFQEYLNVPASLIERFYPHIITGNVRQITPKKIASIVLSNGAMALAETEPPVETFLACAKVGKGRFVAIWISPRNTRKYTVRMKL
jgi:hypothetical protein